MKAISLHEPYATFIMWGWKTIETRTHTRFSSLENNKIIIHRTQVFIPPKDADYFDYMDTEKQKRFIEYWNKEANGDFKKLKKLTSKILGTVEVYDFRILDERDSKEAMINCGDEKRFGLFLRKPKQFINQVEINGRQGIFNIPFDIMKTLEYIKPRKDA